MLLEGCGGSVVAGGPEAAAGNPSVAVPSAGAAGTGAAGTGAAGTGGTAPSEVGPGGAGAGPGESCTGTLDSVSSALGLTCPHLTCAATVLASSCDTLPASLSTTSEGTCGAPSSSLIVIELDVSPTRRKACYYSGQFLVGAAAWDDTDTFCDGAASYISAGSVGMDCSRSVLCDRASPEQHPAPAAPRACFNNFSLSCEPCCPTPTPDCTGKPNGYPGYACVPNDNAYCSCTCEGSSWQCAC